MQDLVSVIVPVYNSKDYLEECIKSIINQTYINLQIILVDDASTDISGQICDNFAKQDSRIQVIHRKKNGGQSCARNTGLKHAKGEWVAFIDNDDTYEPTFIDACVGGAKEHNVLIAGCGNLCIRKNETIHAGLKVKSGIYKTDQIVENILYKPSFSWVEVWSKVFHKSLIDKLKFPEGVQLEDYCVVLPVLYSVKKIYYLDKYLYNWRIRESSQSDKLFFDNRLSYVQACEYLISFFENQNAPKKIMDAAYTWQFCVMCRLLSDMCKTKDNENIKQAKNLLPKVNDLKSNIKITKKFTFKSYLHCILRLLFVKFCS